MITYKLTNETIFELQECCNCGIQFLITNAFGNNLRETKQAFHCPNGHSQSYRQSDADRLRKELADKKSQYDIAQSRIRNLTEQINQPKPKRMALRKAV